jgi:hypothetical protein
VEQVSTPLTVAETPGTVLFCVTEAVAIEVQPFDGSVTVSVYVPVVVTVGFCSVDEKLSGPVHA